MAIPLRPSILSFQYDAIPDGKIRVMHVMPGADTVHVELSVENIKGISYNALSY